MMDGGWSKNSSTLPSCSISRIAASSTRWLSNWIVTPIFRLGYCPLTFERLPRTRRAGGDERIRSISPWVRSAIPNRLYQAIRSSPLSMAFTSRAR